MCRRVCHTFRVDQNGDVGIVLRSQHTDLPADSRQIPGTDVPVADTSQNLSSPGPGMVSVAACPMCGHFPQTRAEALRQGDDLTIVWLHQDSPTGPVTQRQHCAACQPHTVCTVLECDRCGTGPILTGTLAKQASQHGQNPIPAATHTWLASHGWHLEPELLCPNHQ